MREFDFIQWIREQARFNPSLVEVGPGDDCAVLNLGGEKLLLTTDQVLDGVHFSLEDDGPEAAGRKAAARNLSDIAAMAGEPVAMLAALAAPQGFSQDDAQAVYRGLATAGLEFNCPLVGGDVAAWHEDGRLIVTVTVLGRAGGVGPVLRSGARKLDAVCITGRLGGAWNSRRDMTFTPRLFEARILAQQYGARAMIDLSDGLARDLGHIVEESHWAAEIDAAAIPIHEDAAGRDDPLAAALYDGEDYELLFALPPDECARLLANPPFRTPVTRIGTMVPGLGMTLLRNGRREPLAPGGWEHQT